MTQKGGTISEPDIGDREFTGYTFGLSYTEWLLRLRNIPVAELEDRLEIKRMLSRAKEEMELKSIKVKDRRYWTLPTD